MLAVIGPTAAGKSALALRLAQALGDVELVSADAMQVYRGMDIGTAKPASADQRAVPHHLIDVVGIDEGFDLPTYLDLGNAALDDIAARGRRALVVGGTGLYVQGIVDGLTPPGRWPDVRGALDADEDTAGLHARLAGLDPIGAARMEPNNRRRVVRALEVTLGSGRPFSSFGPGMGAYPEVPTTLVGVDPGPEELDRRIERRAHLMLAAGWLDEVAGLVARPGDWSPTARQALGYRELSAHLAGELTLAEALDLTVLRTKKFARRQRRWFRRDPRIRWLPGDASVEELVRTWGGHMA